MKLLLKRIFRGPKYTIGHLYIDGEYFCDTLEDVDRGLSSDMPLSEIKRIKIADKTAIPTGEYKITLDIVSPRFSKQSKYKFCNGKLPRLLNVPGYEGVLIHIGNTADDTSGCLLVGYNKQVGKVLNSTDTFRRLYGILKTASELTIEVR